MIESFDSSFQPPLDRKPHRRPEPARLDDRAEVVHLLGPPRTGKSHLAVALGIAAANARLLHHAVVIHIEGASYRFREHTDRIPEHVRANAPIAPPPAPKRRGRPPRRRTAGT